MKNSCSKCKSLNIKESPHNKLTGYNAYRCLDCNSLFELSSKSKTIFISGHTGSGKTFKAVDFLKKNQYDKKIVITFNNADPLWRDFLNQEKYQKVIKLDYRTKNIKFERNGTYYFYSDLLSLSKDVLEKNIKMIIQALKQLNSSSVLVIDELCYHMKDNQTLRDELYDFFNQQYLNQILIDQDDRYSVKIKEKEIINMNEVVK